MNILITGANGQLGRSIHSISKYYPEHEYFFTDVDKLDITDLNQVMDYFKDNTLDFCINAAAYTNVDKAEVKQELNNKINITGPSNIGFASKNYNVKLIHISSDYVYNNNHQNILTEESPTLAEGIYAVSKLQGEKEVIKQVKEHFIIRTSWLYSEYGHNFVKTILKLCKEKKELKVINDQIGSPTYAMDLAAAIFTIINKNNNKFGIYNYSNTGYISWYDFAKKIKEFSGLNCKILPIQSKEYPTKTPRPLNSRLSKEKFKNTFDTIIPNWDDSLKKCMGKM